MNLAALEKRVSAIEERIPAGDPITHIRIVIMRPGANGPEETGEVIMIERGVTQ